MAPTPDTTPRGRSPRKALVVAVQARGEPGQRPRRASYCQSRRRWLTSMLRPASDHPARNLGARGMLWRRSTPSRLPPDHGRTRARTIRGCHVARAFEHRPHRPRTQVYRTRCTRAEAETPASSSSPAVPNARAFRDHTACRQRVGVRRAPRATTVRAG